MTHVVFDLNGGGFESLIADMARRQAGMGVTVSAISLSGRVGRVGRQIQPLLDQYHLLNLLPGVSMIWPLELTHAIRGTGADVVHLHSGSWYKGSVAAHHAGVPVVYTEHGREHHDPLLARWLDQRAARHTAAVVAVSDRLARYMARVLHVPAARLRTIQNGVDTSVFTPGARPSALRGRLGIPPEALVVGSIGRLEPVKAYTRLINAVAAMRASNAVGCPVIGVLWGEGSARAALEARIAELGLGGAFLLPGWTENAAESHRLLDVFALTSISEGASVSLMESLASGVTPLVMDVGANAEVLGPLLAAQVVPAGDEAAFTAELTATVSDDARRERAAVAGRRRVESHYSLDAMLRAYGRLYRELVSNCRRGSG